VLKNFKNIIFDLGGVIIDLDFQAAYGAFSTLSGLSLHEVKQRVFSFTEFIEYEKGLTSSQEFRIQIKELFQISVSDEAVDRAWCAMLGRIPLERLALLKRLQGKYRTFALSNTNDIHANKFDSIVEESLGSAVLFKAHFESVYYSHEMKMRKPDEEIYLAVLNDQGLRPEETLFIDDTLKNVQAAASLGIQTLHLKDPRQLIPFFNGSR